MMSRFLAGHDARDMPANMPRVTMTTQTGQRILSPRYRQLTSPQTPQHWREALITSSLNTVWLLAVEWTSLEHEWHGRALVSIPLEPLNPYRIQFGGDYPLPEHAPLLVEMLSRFVRELGL